jgi:ubiquitin-protein ligase
MNQTLRNLLVEINQIKNDPIEGAEMTIDNDTLEIIVVKFDVPNDLPYGTNEILLLISITPDYPNKHPVCAFEPPIFHPNVNQQTGEICHPIVEQDKWSQFKSLRTLIHHMQTLIFDPNPNSALNSTAASEFRKYIK